MKILRTYLNKIFRLFWGLVFFSACSHHNAQLHKGDELLSIQIIDRNGMSETIGAKEKLIPYQIMDFQNPQPYKQVLRIYAKDQEGKSHCKLTSYHPNGQIFQYLEGRDTRANGAYYEWFANGKKKINAYVVEGPADLNSVAQKNWLFDGLCQIWDEEDQLIAEISYDKGMLEGESKYYHKNAKVEKILPYIRDELHGEVCEFYENGNLKSKSFFERGGKTGPSLGYWENEMPSFIENYQQDNLLTGIYWNRRNEIIAEVQEGNGTKAVFGKEDELTIFEVQKGRSEGKVQIFTKEGFLQREHLLKNSQKQGEEIEYYLPQEVKVMTPNGKPLPKLQIYWDEGNVHGTVKTWYEDNKLESQKEMHHNKKNGMSCGWYQEGSLMFIEEYENDKLMMGTYYRMKDPEPVSKIINGSGTATLFDGKTGQFLKKIQYAASKPQE